MSDQRSSDRNFTPPPNTPDFLVRQAPDNVWDRLLEASLALDAALQLVRGNGLIGQADRVEYTGSVALAEQFRVAVLDAHHVRGS